MNLPAYYRRNALRWTRLSVVGVLCCAIIGGTLGFPSVKRVAKDRSKPFPCQDKPCGCGNAESCWRSCCCHTNREKLAWAKKHDVVVPDFVIAAAALEGPQATGTCCQSLAKANAACCETSPEEATTKPVESTEIQWMLSDSYRKCQGQPLLWSVLSQAMVSETKLPLVGRPVAGEWMVTTSESVCGLSLPPRLRPPRA